MDSDLLRNLVNVGAFFADPNGECPQVNIMGAVIGFLIEYPERLTSERLTSDEEDALFRDACAWADIATDGEPLDTDESLTT